MLLVAQEFRVFLGLRSSPSITRGATFSSSALLASSSFGILMIDLGHNVTDFRVGVRLDKVPEEIGKAEQVSKSSNGIIFLFERERKGSKR